MSSSVHRKGVIVLPDACVLVPAALRDTIFRSAKSNLFRIRLSEDIMKEVKGVLVRNGMASEDSVSRLMSAVETKFEGQFVMNYQRLIPQMPVNQKDKHVLAAAVKGNVDFIVTSNLKDFPDRSLSPFNIRAISPDEFLTNLYIMNKERLVKILSEQAKNLTKPPMNELEVLDRLMLDAPKFAQLAQEHFKQQKSLFAFAKIRRSAS